MIVDNQCDACHIGILQNRRVTYAARWGSGVVLLPDINVFICDVCGEAIYDPEIMARVQMLLGADLASSSTAHHSEAGSEPVARSHQFSQRRHSA